MKVTQKTIEGVVGEIIGEEVFPLVNILRENKNLSEFEISNRTKMAVDIVRNYLYRLYNNNLVTFIRKKDKKKGWYIYYWNLNIERIRYLVTDLKKKRIEKLRERLEREKSSHFFVCINQCIRVDFEQATNFEFRCPECGELLNQEDNAKKILEIHAEIANTEKELSDIGSKEKEQPRAEIKAIKGKTPRK